VAREAGVSIATVSRVVHGQDRVRASTRDRVLQVIEALGYVPDSAAQNLARQRKEVIGLVAIESRSSDTDVEQGGLLFIEEVLRGVETRLGDLGWSVLNSVLRGVDPADTFQRMQKISAKVDGMLIAEGIVGSEQLGLLAARVPVVLVSGAPDELNADVVYSDNQTGTRALVDHIVRVHRRTRLFYVSGPPGAPDARDRERSFGQAVAQHPSVTVTGSYEGRFAAISGQLAVRELLSLPRRELPDAIVCANDQMAIGALRELLIAGLRVPADIAVVGFDDIHLGALLSPALTTVHQPMRLLGERACALVLDRLADPTLPHRVEQLPTHLVVRESCGCSWPAPPGYIVP
jgi:LacI family transcriptional regulator